MKIPNLTDSKGRVVIAVAVLLVVVLLAVGLWAALYSQDEAPAPADKQADTNSSDTAKHEEDMRRGTDGQLEFAFDINNVRAQVEKISDGSPVSRVPRQDNQFVTVVLEVRNPTELQKSLNPSSQILITKSGQRITAEAGLQAYVADGDWYEFIAAESSASGLLVFEVGVDELIDRFEFHADQDTNGATLKLHPQQDEPKSHDSAADAAKKS